MALASAVAVARRFAFVTETEGQNAGTWVSLFQRFTGNRPGDFWCASFVSFVLDVVYRGPAPLRRTSSCDEMLNEAIQRKFITKDPQPGDLFFYVRGGHQTLLGDAYHVGIVTVRTDLTLDGIAGNTSPDGASANGDGVHEHALTHGGPIVFVRLPRN